MAKKQRDKKIFDIRMPEKKSSVVPADINQLEYPVFSFKYLQDVSIKDCTDPNFFFKFLMRMKKLSELGWKEIRISQRHAFGMEKIPADQIKPKSAKHLTPDVTEFQVFRAVGDNRPFLGFQTGCIFHVVYIESDFGDIYNH